MTRRRALHGMRSSISMEVVYEDSYSWLAPSNLGTSTRKSKEVVIIRDPEEVDYDTALDAEGYGLFTRSALCANVIAYFSGGTESVIMSYVLPAAKCDLHISMYETGLINMMYSAGGIVSALFWAVMGDVYGRRDSIRLTLLIDGVLTFLESLIRDYRIFLVARCINGFLIGAAGALVISYAADLFGPKRRNVYISIVGTSYIAPWLVLPGVAWLIMPRRMDTHIPIHSWRLFLILGSFPPLIAAVWLSFLPESPRFLMNTNRPEEALNALTKIYKINFGKKAEYRIKKLIPDELFKPTSIRPGQTTISYLLQSVLGDLKLFVSKKYIRQSSLMAFVFAANYAAGFGLNFWIPELLVRLQIQSCDEEMHDTITELGNYPENNNNVTYHLLNNVKGMESEKCDSRMDNKVFISGLIVGACCVLGNFMCSLLSLRSGPKCLRATCAGFGGIVALVCLTLAGSVCLCNGSTSVGVVSAAILNAGSLIENILLVTLILHAVPAKLSSLAVSWGCWWGRSGGMAANFAIGSLLDINCPMPFLGVAVVSALSILAILLIKIETKSAAQRFEEQIIKELADIRRSQTAVSLQKLRSQTASMTAHKETSKGSK